MPELRQVAWLGEDIIGQAALPPLRAAMDGVALDRNAMRVHQMFAASLADGQQSLAGCSFPGRHIRADRKHSSRQQS